MEEERRSGKKSKLSKDEEGAIPPHILNIMKSVDKKQKHRKKEHELKKQGTQDSISLIRSMMSSVRTKCELVAAEDGERQDKEQDIAMISNARDIFKHLEHQDAEEDQQQRVEKVKRVEVKPDFLLSGVNKAEEMRKERLREMTAMKVARERQMEEEERYQNEERDKTELLRREREREMELMRMMRQQAMEEEEEERRRVEVESRGMRPMSPGLAAARQGFKMEPRDNEEDRVERLRLEREREIAELRRARALQMEMEQEDPQSRHERSEATRELEAFRAARIQPVSDRYNEEQHHHQQQQQQQQLPRAPKSKSKLADGWMRRGEEDKVEEMRKQREKELEMMMEARNIAFAEEEEERMQEEQIKREEAAMKAREMAVLVAELQKMRNQTAADASEDQKMTKYQEEMMQRVMELHAIAQGNMIAN